VDVSVGVLIASCSFGRRPLLEGNLICCLRVLNIMLVVVLVMLGRWRFEMDVLRCITNVCVPFCTLLLYLRILCVCCRCCCVVCCFV